MANAATDQWTCPTCGSNYPRDFALCPRDATPRADGEAKTGDPLIGAVLGRTYRVTKVLGEGGMARLYEAEHLRIDAKYAVKVMHHELSTYDDQLARFEREAKAAAKIHSTNVVQLVDVLQTSDGRPCLVEELLSGEDLQMRLDKVGKLPLSEAIPIARQICHAIADAHAAGVVHRDLKPSNVFLCERDGGPLVKVFDFGIAKIEDDEKLTRTGAVIGTAAYMSPEQARRAADAGPLADIYSIGAVIYHMVAGQPPYGNLPPVSRFALLLHEEPARPRSIEPSIPEGFEAVIQQAMARDRTVRIQSAHELEARLAAFEAKPPAAIIPASRKSAPQPSTEHTALQIARRARITRPLAATLSVLACVAAAAWIGAFLFALVAPTSSGENGMIAAIAFGAFAAVGIVEFRTLRAHWNSSPAVARHAKPLGRGLLAGALVLGALDLLSYGTHAVLHGELLGTVARLLASGVAAALGLGFERFALDERLRRWIG